MSRIPILARHQLDIQAQLAGRTVPGMARIGEALTQPELDILAVLAKTGPFIDAAAVAGCVSENTVKYRVERIRQKYGLSVTRNRAWTVLREAVRRGDAAIGDETAAVRAFAAKLRSSLPAGPLGDGMRDWLDLHTDRYLRQRGEEAA